MEENRTYETKELEARLAELRQELNEVRAVELGQELKETLEERFAENRQLEIYDLLKKF